MADQRALDAASRIERALARIEAAAARPAAPSDPADSDMYRRLRSAHDSLRTEVADVIGEIDRLVSAGERG